MAEFALSDLLRLTAASDDPADHLRQSVDWRIQRAGTELRGVAGTAVASVLALLAAYLGGNDVPGWLLAVVGIGLVASGWFTWIRLATIRALEQDYIIALNVLRELAPLTPLIRLAPSLYVR